jgi:hypothetical protein
MPHPDEGTIHAWLDGALPDADATAVEAHVSECASCREAVAEARGLIAAASRVVSALDVVPGGVLPETRPTATPAPARRARWAGWPLRAAAAVLLVAGGTAVVLRERGVTVLGESGAAATMTAAREAEPAAVPPAAPSNAPTPAPAPSAAAAPSTAAPSTAAPSQRARAERRRVADTVRELAPLPQRAPRQELAAAPAPEPPVARAQPLQQLQGKLAGAPVVSSLQSEVAAPAAPAAQAADAAQAGERRIMLRGAASLTVAGTGTVTGVVRDANGRELQAAQVTVQGTRLGTTTDSVGRFTLRGVPPGAQTLVARRVGYERARQQVTVRPDSIPELALELRASTVALSEVVVTGVAGASLSERAAGCWLLDDDRGRVLRLAEPAAGRARATAMVLPEGTRGEWSVAGGDVRVIWDDATGRTELRLRLEEDEAFTGRRTVRLPRGSEQSTVRARRIDCPETR